MRKFVEMVNLPRSREKTKSDNCWSDETEEGLSDWRGNHYCEYSIEWKSLDIFGRVKLSHHSRKSTERRWEKWKSDSLINTHDDSERWKWTSSDCPCLSGQIACMCEVDQKHTIEMDVDGVEIEKKENEKKIRLGWRWEEKTFRRVFFYSTTFSV